MSERSSTVDVLIVGAGPGGIAAAVTAGEARKSVAVVDDGAFAGGQIWRNRGSLPRGAEAARWIGRLQELETAGRISWHRQSRVVARLSATALLIETPDGPLVLKWRALILATGARELFLPFPGWTLPGVIGAGAIQALMKQGLPVKGKRVIVAGTGPLLLAVADLLRSNGATVPVILEQASASAINRFALSLARWPTKLLAGMALRARLLGCGYSTDSYPLRVAKEAATLRVDYRTGARDASKECDYLACGFNLIPNVELPQLLGCELTDDGFVRVDDRLRTTTPTIYAIGELTGIGGVDKSIQEGQIAASSATGNGGAVLSLEGRDADRLKFTWRLAAAFELRPELFKLAEPSTIICRCEDVQLSTISQSINARDAKLQTRCGMGPCQGRVCGPILQRLLGCEAQQVRPPLFATSIQTLAAAGHAGDS